MSEARRQRRAAQRANDSFSSLSRGMIREAADQKTTISSGSYRNQKDLYLKKWLAARVVDVVAEDMTREGIEIEGLEDSKQSAILRAMTDLGAWEAVTEAIKQARATGGSGIIPLLKGAKNDEPIALNKLSKNCIDSFVVRERMDLMPEGTGLITSGRDYGLPEYYQEALGIGRVHHSRVIRFMGRKIPYRDMMNNSYWGKSILEVIESDIDGYEAAKTASGELIRYSYLRTLSVDGLSDNIRNGCDAEILKRFKTVSELQAYFNLTIMDGKDAMHGHSYNFAGIPEVIRGFAQAVSGSEGIPMTKLFGQSPDGMNATGESDLENYYSNIRMRQESDLRRPITYLVNLIHIHLFGQQLPPECEICFKPLRIASEAEEVDIGLKEAQIAKTKAETLDIYAGGNSGMILSPEQFKSEIMDLELDDIDQTELPEIED